MSYYTDYNKLIASITNERALMDIQQGKYSEKKVVKWLNDNTFKDNQISLYKNPFNYIDMVSKDNKNRLELKSRNITHKQYPDLMIGLNKINEAKKFYSEADYHFLFLCKDGLYGWIYSPDKKLNFRRGGRTDRGKDEIRDQAFIPSKDLFCITTEINSIS